MALPKMTIRRTYTFEAAHFLPKVPEGHKCKRVHGHSYRVDVAVTNTANPYKEYWVMDFAELDKMMHPILRGLDHSLLNDTVANPTVEALARHIFNSFNRRDFVCLGLSITVHEGDDGSATYEGMSA